MSKEKTERNEEIKKLYKKSKGKLTYRDLAKKYKRDVKTVWNIVNR